MIRTTNTITTTTTAIPATHQHHEHLDLELLEALDSCTLAWVVAPDEASIFD